MVKNKLNTSDKNKFNKLNKNYKEPCIIDDYSGIIHLRGTCGEKPCGS
jgi:hypothetical protein